MTDQRERPTPTDRTALLIRRLKSIPQKDWAETIKPVFEDRGAQRKIDLLMDERDRLRQSHAALVEALRDCLGALKDAHRTVGLMVSAEVYDGVIGNMLSAEDKARAALRLATETTEDR